MKKLVVVVISLVVLIIMVGVYGATAYLVYYFHYTDPVGVLVTFCTTVICILALLDITKAQVGIYLEE